MYYHLDFCIYHFQIQIVPRKCLALLTAPINSFPTVNLYPQSTRPRPREVELMIMSLKKCTNWAVNQPVDVAKNFSVRHISFFHPSAEPRRIYWCRTVTLLFLLFIMSSGGYTVTRLQCKVFQINRTNVLSSVFLSQPTQSLCLQDCVQSVGGQMWIWGAFLRGRSSLRYSAL